MKEGDVVMAVLAQADGRTKDRPVILLCQMPPFGDWLVCGVSTPLQREVPGFDELLSRTDPDFADSGLWHTSLIRLGYLETMSEGRLLGEVGAIAPARLLRLLTRLSQHISP